MQPVPGRPAAAPRGWVGGWRSVRPWIAVAALSGLMGMVGCLERVHGPLGTIEHPREAGTRARRLMVLLPGLGDRAEDYARHGLIAAARTGGLDADLLAVEAHYSYYARDEIVERLYTEVIEPARQHYAEVWLVGISLGGLGAILTAREHPDSIDGLVLLAPYLGPSHLPRTILAEGGMRAWEPPPPPAAYAWDVELWTWLKRYEDPDPGLPPIYIGYGRQDEMALSNALLAELLPRDHVVIEDGAHYWATWAGLWERMVSDGLPVLRDPLRWPTAMETAAPTRSSAL